MRKPTTVNYIDKQEFLKEIIEYKKACNIAEKKKKPKPKIPDKIAKRLWLIAENVSKKPCYNKYTYRDIMVSDAVENMIRYFDNFDPKHPKQNPFGYFTQYAIYAFSRRIHIENTELYKKYKLLQQSNILDTDQKEEYRMEDGEIPEMPMYDNINEFIKKYENNLNKSKTKEPKKKKAKGVEKFIEG